MTSDRLFVYLDQNLLIFLISYAQSNSEDFNKYLKRNFTSRPGFIPLYSSDLNEWLTKLSKVFDNILANLNNTDKHNQTKQTPSTDLQLLNHPLNPSSLSTDSLTLTHVETGSLLSFFLENETGEFDLQNLKESIYEYITGNTCLLTIN